MEKKIQGKLGVNKEQLISLLGSTMYKGDVQNVAIKELVQNSFDAVKIAHAMDSSFKGEIHVKNDIYQRTITVKDNGIGMSPEIVQKAFFTIGGSYKGNNVDNRLKSGGLGLAKMAFLFSSEYVEVSTVHDGWKTYVKATPEDIQSDNFQLVVSKTDEPNGTEVTVKIPEGYTDSNGEYRTIYLSWSPSFFNKTMLGEVTLHVNDATYDKRNAPKEYLYIGKATSAFGDMDIYIAPNNGSTIRSEILISGLYQFTDNIYEDGQRSIKTIVNILPKVGVNDPLYPINNQREGFRATVDKEIKDLRDLLKKINNAFLRGQYAASFNSCLTMDVEKVSEPKRIPFEGEILKAAVAEVTGQDPAKEFIPFTMVAEAFHEVASKKDADRASTFDASGVKLPEAGMVDTSGMSLDKPVFHNNTDLVIGQDAMPFLKELGTMMLQLKSLHNQAYYGKKRIRETSWGTTHEMDLCERSYSQFWGISFDKNYQGVNVNPRLFNFLAINPFAVQLPEWEGIDQALYISDCLVHMIIHEYNHNYESNEGSGFTGSLVMTEAEFTSIGPSFERWKEDLVRLVRKNLKIITEYHVRYNQASNTSMSLDA